MTSILTALRLQWHQWHQCQWHHHQRFLHDHQLELELEYHTLQVLHQQNPLAHNLMLGVESLHVMFFKFDYFVHFVSELSTNNC